MFPELISGFSNQSARINKKHFPRIRQFAALLFALFLLLFPVPRTVHAATKPATITECRLINTKTIQVKAEVKNLSKLVSDTVYLFAIGMNQTKPSVATVPCAASKAAKTMTFRLPLNAKNADSRLNCAFLLADKKKNGSYRVISSRCFLSNPGKLAKYKYKFPTAISKKGLQISAFMLEDAVELGVRNSAINIVISDLIASASERNERVSVPYKYHGKTYWYRKAAVFTYDQELTAMKETKSVNAAILLLGWREDLLSLIYPSARQQTGHAFFAWNTSSASAREELSAALSFLARRYSPSNGTHGTIVNWIVGNEVNSYTFYNYAGKKSLPQYASIYASAFRLTYNTVTSVYRNARVYISLDHLWNINYLPGQYSAHKMLDAFAKALKKTGNIPWNLAYHPYSSPLTDPRFWANENLQLTNDLASPVINMGNIGVLTGYIRSTYGSGTRIILSEQGYTSEQNSKDVSSLQAAAIAYSYYLTEADDMIDSFIMNRHVDNRYEVQQGLNLGLWNTEANAVEWASDKKESWSVFKYMDTSLSKKNSSFALDQIGAKNWKELIPSYSSKLYNKTSYQTVALQIVNSYQETASVPKNWEAYGAVSSLSPYNSNSMTLMHDPAKNRNVLWGVVQDFSKKPLNAKKYPSLAFTAEVTGAQLPAGGVSPYVTAKVLINSSKHTLEASCKIPTNRPIPLAMSLSKWKYRDKITSIKILILPADRNTWTKSASLTLSYPVHA